MSAPAGRGSPLGPSVGPAHLRRAAKALLETWCPFYVAQTARENGVELPPFKDFVNQPLNSPESVGERPRYVIAVPGILAEPERRGDGTYTAVFDLQIALWLWGGHYEETQDLLGYYTAAVRQLVLQHPSLGGLARGCAWRAERYYEVAPTSYRTWGQAVISFGVTVEGVVNVFAGPMDPPLDPTAPAQFGPTVTDVAVTVRTIEETP